jgi:hypothetical protein
MAIKFKDVKRKLGEGPLTTEELKMITKIEDYIDKKIMRVFDNDEVRVDLCIANFKYMPGEDKQINLKEARRLLMISELNSRYREAGWGITTHLDDGLDGPNMSGSDFWILKGIK